MSEVGSRGSDAPGRRIETGSESLLRTEYTEFPEKGKIKINTLAEKVNTMIEADLFCRGVPIQDFADFL